MVAPPARPGARRCPSPAAAHASCAATRPSRLFLEAFRRPGGPVRRPLSRRCPRQPLPLRDGASFRTPRPKSSLSPLAVHPGARQVARIAGVSSRGNEPHRPCGAPRRREAVGSARRSLKRSRGRRHHVTAAPANHLADACRPPLGLRLAHRPQRRSARRRTPAQRDPTALGRCVRPRGGARRRRARPGPRAPWAARPAAGSARRRKAPPWRRRSRTCRRRSRTPSPPAA